MILLTRQVPHRWATSAGAGAQGFEPCPRVLEARCSPRSIPLKSGQRAEGKGFEPSFPTWGNRLSRTARQTVSDYLPFEWTAGESNPDFRILFVRQASWPLDDGTDCGQ